MNLHFSSAVMRVVIPKPPHNNFFRLNSIGTNEGFLLKDSLPEIAQNSVLIIDSNFADPCKGIDITRYLLERNNTGYDREIAHYILKSTYGELKTVFELAKQGRVITPPHIELELEKRNEVVGIAIRKSQPHFHQRGYFNQFYKEEYSKEMTRYAQGIEGMSRGSLKYIKQGGGKFRSEFQEAQEVAESFYLKHTFSSKVDGKTPSLEDTILTHLGTIVRDSVICSDDRDCYSVLDSMKNKDGKKSLYLPPICSSTHLLIAGNECFSNKFGRFAYHSY